jgi:cytosine/adenosine deaminase-related metal-dependent hydrolase
MDDESADRFASGEQILAMLSAAHRSLIIHGNYLTDAQLDLIATSRESVAVVYCPRTAAAFGHPPHPIERCLERGIRVFFGTDSRASSPDLRLLEDLKAAYAAHPALGPRVLWEAATVGPREFLGLAKDRGTLCVGSRGPLAVIRSENLPADDGGDLIESFFAASTTATLFDLSTAAELAQALR